jgi:hypothetical protein
MSAKIENFENGFITVKVSDKLTQPEFAAVQHAASGMVRQHGNIRILVLMENFQGWERGGDWEDLSFLEANDQYMEKMAIVGEKKWEDLALIFTGQGFRKCLIEYFQPDEVAKARAWLMENP